VYTKDQVKAAFWRRFRGAGELWFPYFGAAEYIDKSVDDVWQGMAQELDARMTPSQQSAVPLLYVAPGQTTTGRGNDPAKHLTPMQPFAADTSDIVAPTTSFRTLVVGIRRFQTKQLPNNNSRSALATWTWPTMLRCPGISEKRTPVPWRRLQDVGLVGIDAIDLLPPGGDVNEAEAVLQARYVQGCLSALDSVGLGYDLVVLLGGKVSNAFKAADIRLNEMRLLEYRLGCITLPSPHVVETDAEGWWSNDAKMARMRSVISKIVQRRCILCINGDTVEDGCVKCSQHSRGCVVGGFCAICRKGG
jgi:hypothetical protein